MRIRIKSMLGGHASWSIVMRSLAKELGSYGSLYLESINGIEELDEDLLDRIKPCFNSDLDLAYTMPENFKTRFLSKSKVKAAIYNYESSLLPEPWRGSHKHIDFILPSSNYCKKVFVDSGFPEEKVIVVPHGINQSEYSGDEKCEDIDQSLFNFLNISIPHHRKNLDKLIEAYFLEFKHDEGVCLNIKTKIINPKKYFEVNILDIIKRVQSKFDIKLPRLNVLTKRYDSMYPLYNASDAFVSATSSEGFGMPMLESMASNTLVVCPNQTGQSDFLNKDNSIDIFGKYIPAPKEYQYWRPSAGSKIFMPDIESIRNSMRSAYNGGHEEKVCTAKYDSKKLTWKSAAKKIVDIL